MGLSVTAGGALLAVQLIPLPSGSTFASPASLALVADDPAVVTVPDPADTTGTVFDVTAPATDTNASFNLNATGLAPSPTPGEAPVAITGTAQVTIVPAPPPSLPPAQSIGIVAAPALAGGIASVIAAAKG